MLFNDPDAVAQYTKNLFRQVPAVGDLHRMTHHLLSRRAPALGDILVLGAGGGVELKAFAEASPGWKFTGVDPSAPMIALGKSAVGASSTRIDWIEGYIDSAPQRMFDGATCLLTMHFLSVDERLRTLREISRRLKPGAPFIMAHHSVTDDAEAKLAWFETWASYVEQATGTNISARAKSMAENLPTLPPEREVELLIEAGFERPTLFYAALTFRGWVSYAPV